MTSIHETYMNLYENKNDDADVTFVVHEQEVKAHKNIVTGRSAMLKAMLNSDLVPPDGRYPINDEKIKVEDFKQFLKFLYLDECDVDYNNIGALLHMGDMYFVPSLKEKCMKFVRDQCATFEGNIRCCELGAIYEKECPDMIKVCIRKLAQKEFGNYEISAELIERISKDCCRTRTLTEDDLFVKIIEWGKAECTRRKITINAEGIKNVLSAIIKHIKFENVSIHSWLHIIDPYQLAPLEECHQHLIDFAKTCSNSSLQVTPQMLKNGAIQSQEKNVDDDEPRPSNSPATQERNDDSGFRGRGGGFRGRNFRDRSSRGHPHRGQSGRGRIARGQNDRGGRGLRGRPY